MGKQKTKDILEGAFGAKPADASNGQALGIAELGAQYLLLRAQEEQVDKDHKDLKDRLGQAETALWNALESNKLKSIKTAAGEMLTAAVRT